MMHCYNALCDANATGDKLCNQLFFDAGYQPGRHVMALIPQVDPVSILSKACALFSVLHPPSFAYYI